VNILKAGKLRHRVTIKRPTKDNQHNTTYAELATVWAEIKPLYGVQLEYAKAMHANTTHQITARYTDVQAFDCIEFGSRTFNVLSVRNTEEQNREVVLLAVENG